MVTRASSVTREALVSVLALFALVSIPESALAQGAAGTERGVDVSGAVSVTNKGISTIPSFTLGKPAAIFELAIRKGDLGFEPQLRFGLDGQPWTFLFWVRYRPLTDGKFQLTVGGHPAYAFRTIAVSTAGVSRDLIQVRRYLAVDLTPNYLLTDHVSVGAYYLYSHGIDEDAAAHTHFISARVTVSNVTLAGRYSLQVAPQLYYLSTDGQDGTYLSSTVTLARQASPWSVSSTINKPLRSNVTGGQAFLWNVSANYAIR